MEGPSISVLMPLYNSKEHVGEAIESIFRQSFQDFEFLIVDDSDDGSSEVVEQYAEQDRRIRHIRNDPPLGLRASSNLGLREARGKYIARMEADDISKPSRLEEQFDLMEKNPELDVSGCQLELFGNEEGVWTFPLSHEAIRASIVWGISIAHPTSFFRRNFLLEHGFFYKEEGFPFAEDWEFFHRMIHTGRFQNLNRALYVYRRGNESVTQRMKERSEALRNEMFTKVLEDLGVTCSDEDLEIHKLAMGQGELEVTFENLARARQHVDRLIRINQEQGLYDKEIFQRVAEAKWDRLFFRAAPKGVLLTLRYFILSGRMKKGYLSYFLKLTVRRWLGLRRNKG